MTETRTEWLCRFEDAPRPYQEWKPFDDECLVQVKNAYGDITISKVKDCWWGYETEMGGIGSGVIVYARKVDEETTAPPDMKKIASDLHEIRGKHMQNDVASLQSQLEEARGIVTALLLLQEDSMQETIKKAPEGLNRDILQSMFDEPDPKSILARARSFLSKTEKNNG